MPGTTSWDLVAPLILILRPGIIKPRWVHIRIFSLWIFIRKGSVLILSKIMRFTLIRRDFPIHRRGVNRSLSAKYIPTPRTHLCSILTNRKLWDWEVSFFTHPTPHSFPWLYLFASCEKLDLFMMKMKLNSTSSRNTKRMQATIHISRQVT